MALGGEQAEVQLAFGGEAGAVAIAAKGLRHAADHANFAQTGVVPPVRACIAPAFGGFACDARVKLHQRQFGMKALHHLGAGQYLVHAPAVGRAHVHVFNEAQDHAAALKVAGHRQNLVVVCAAFDDHVDFDRPQAHGLRSFQAVQHLGHWKAHVVHALKNRIVQAVQTDGDALQTRVFQRTRLFLEQTAVGRQRQVQRQAVGRAQRGELFDENFDVLAQQRLATCEPNFLHPMRDEGPRHTGDFLKRQERAVRQVAVVVVEHLFGHAVVAAEIAAVGDADAQIPQRPPKAIAQQARGRDGQIRQLRRHGVQPRIQNRYDTFRHKAGLSGTTAAGCESSRVGSVV